MGSGGSKVEEVAGGAGELGDAVDDGGGRKERRRSERRKRREAKAGGRRRRRGRRNGGEAPERVASRVHPVASIDAHSSLSSPSSSRSPSSSPSSSFSSRRKEYCGGAELTAELREVIKKWNLTTQDVRYLHQRFCELDADGSGAVDVDEFFALINEQRTLFLDTMFSLMVGGRKELDFAMWVHVVFTFCLSTREEMVERVFMVFDKNRDGFIDIGELHNFLVSLHSDNPIFPQEIVTSLTEMCLSQDGRIDFDDLQQADSQHPMLLWPVFRINHRMRKRTLGYSFFQRIDSRLSETWNLNDHHEHLRRKWRHRIDGIKMLCCGWRWCRREQELRPTPLVEIEARKRAIRTLRQAQVRRMVNPTGAGFRYKPLPVGPHHVPTDDLIERNVYQSHIRPIRDSELRQEPPTVQALDEAGVPYDLSTSGSESGDLVEYGLDDEYPDLVADSGRRRGFSGRKK